MCEFLKFLKLWIVFSRSPSAIHFEFRSLFVISLKKKRLIFCCLMLTAINFLIAVVVSVRDVCPGVTRVTRVQ